MRQLLAAVLAVGAMHAHAVPIAYDWSIDWGNDGTINESGSFVFDALGRLSFDLSDGDSFKLMPHFIGTPPWPLAGYFTSWAATADGYLTRWSSCSDPDSSCQIGFLNYTGFRSLDWQSNSYWGTTTLRSTDPCYGGNGLTIPVHCQVVSRGTLSIEATGPYLPAVVSPAPEPSTYALLALGLAAVGFTARHRRLGSRASQG